MRASQVAQWQSICLPRQETQEAWVWSLGWEDRWEHEIVTHSSILARKIPWTEKPGRQQSIESQRVGHDSMTDFGCISLWKLSINIYLFSLYTIYHTSFSTKDGITIDALIFLLLHKVDRKVPRMEIIHLWWGRIIEIPENS